MSRPTLPTWMVGPDFIFRWSPPDQDWYCELCQKWATQGHVECDKHFDRLRDVDWWLPADQIIAYQRREQEEIREYAAKQELFRAQVENWRRARFGDPQGSGAGAASSSNGGDVPPPPPPGRAPDGVMRPPAPAPLEPLALEDRVQAPDEASSASAGVPFQ